MYICCIKYGISLSYHSNILTDIYIHLQQTHFRELDLIMFKSTFLVAYFNVNLSTLILIIIILLYQAVSIINQLLQLCTDRTICSDTIIRPVRFGQFQ